jgi:hypothetical protein
VINNNDEKNETAYIAASPEEMGEVRWNINLDIEIRECYF